MLNTIKNIIKEKKVFQEAAELILEDEAIDDSIILGDDDSYPEEDAEDEVKPEEKPEDEVKPEEPVEEPKEDLLDASLDDPSTPGETLPEPVGAQTNEPAEAGDDIILSTEIDLNSNTPNDTLPTPPVNAADAVEGETDNARVDSGFEGEEEHPADDESLLDTPIDDEDEDEPKEESSTITEAISVGEPVEEPADGENKEDGKPVDEQNPEEGPEEPVEEPKEEDNPVTAAVKDRVSEMNAEDDVNQNSDNKEALFKKLSSLTKGIEDIKASLLKY